MRRRLAFGVGLGLSLLATGVGARPVAPDSCFNDSDCAGPACGGSVCDWNHLAPIADPETPYLCVQAGSKPRGTEGWCTSDENCKCRDLGAKCVGVYCSFTRPEDAPAGGASAAGGGSSAGSTSVAGGSNVGGAPSTAGSASVPPEPEPVGHEDTAASSRTSRACSVSNPGRESLLDASALLAGFVALWAAGYRKRARIRA